MTMLTAHTPAHDALAVLRTLDVGDPQVEVIDQCVYLRGLVGCYKAKHAANQRIAAALPGTCIVNELRVAQRASGDESLVSNIAAGVQRVAPRAASRISIRVHDGVVNIEGRVDSEQERAAIAATAWETPGVTNVQCHTSVEGATQSDEEIAEKLTSYLLKTLHLPNGSIAVRYAAGIGMLTGTAPSRAQAATAEELLRWHQSVKDVVNRLAVSEAA